MTWYNFFNKTKKSKQVELSYINIRFDKRDIYLDLYCALGDEENLAKIIHAAFSDEIYKKIVSSICSQLDVSQSTKIIDHLKILATQSISNSQDLVVNPQDVFKNYTYKNNVH